MILSDKDIEIAVKSGEVTLQPFDKKQLQPASYDIKLTNKFIVQQSHAGAVIDPEKGIVVPGSEVIIKEGETFVLHPGMSVIGYSREYVGSHTHLIEVKSKLSLARVGLLVHNATGLVNPGHFLSVALSLSNINTVPIVLRPGMEIAQLIFSPLSSQSRVAYRASAFATLGGVLRYTAPKSGPLARRKGKKR